MAVWEVFSCKYAFIILKKYQVGKISVLIPNKYFFILSSHNTLFMKEKGLYCIWQL